MHRTSTAVAALALVALLAACGEADMASPSDPTATPEPTAEPTEVETLPVEPDEGIGDGAVPPGRSVELRGVLGGDAQLEGGCAWVDGDDGVRYEVQYPEGFEVRFDPVEVVGPDGAVVATDGDEVVVVGAVGDGMMSFCQVGTIFVAEDVTAG